MASPFQRLLLAAAGEPRRVLDVKRPAGVSLVTLLLIGAVGAWIAYGVVNDSCDVPVVSPRATRRGTLQGCGHGELVSGVRPGSFKFEGVPIVGNGRVAVRVTSTYVSYLVGPLSYSATQRLRELLTQGLPISSLEQVHVNVTDGRLT